MSRWFARVGQPLSPVEEVAIDAFLRSVVPAGPIAIDAIVSWSDAARHLRLTEHDATWWDQEEAEREALWMHATQHRSEADLLRGVGDVTLAVGSGIRDAAIAAATVAGAPDATMAHAASGMALLAAHQAAVAQMAGAGPDHWFIRKYALFTGGRWPLGYHAARFAIF